MSSSLRRGALAAAAIAFSILPLAACGAGNNAQTLQIKPDNAATTVGDIKIQNAVVITQPDRESTGPAAVSATVFNTGNTDQKLESITVEGAGEPVELKPAKGKKDLTVPAGGSLIIGGKDNAAAVVPDGREAVRDGDAQKITFSFSKTGDVSLRAFVVPASGYFSGWGPSEVPAAPGASASTSQEPSHGASASPSGSASAPAGSATPSAGASASASHGASESHEADAGH
ncbi:lipoprotein [Streptomyces cyaneogriseus subsp. noncyanogenus]|uniref:Lipoprotein n=1 Tax=Streptomyces cyaneogriseus subsp. noncyanogenus TaxID=477245 RepID=A0A0C5G3E9_9ACTN|nr:lipoprotein [Streptomyces cyaneogriseus]AJP03100.1 lipoprotein [Streptomyces cyaneogriseus subsp. noncyanogenus]